MCLIWNFIFVQIIYQKFILDWHDDDESITKLNDGINLVKDAEMKDFDPHKINLSHKNHEELDKNHHFIQNSKVDVDNINSNNVGIIVTIIKVIDNEVDDGKEIFENSSEQNENIYKSYNKVVNENDLEGPRNKINVKLDQNFNEDSNYNIHKGINYIIGKELHKDQTKDVDYNVNDDSIDVANKHLEENNDTKLSFSEHVNLNNNGSNDSIYFGSDKPNDSNELVNVDNTSRNNKSTEKLVNDLETPQGNNNDKDLFGNLESDDHVGISDINNHKKEESQEHTNFNVNTTSKKYNNDFQKIDDKASELNTITMGAHPNYTFRVDHACEIHDNTTHHEIYERNSILHGFFDNLIGAKEKIYDVIENKLDNHLNIIDMSNNIANEKYSDVEYKDIIESPINNENVSNRKVGEEIVVEIRNPLDNDQSNSEKSSHDFEIVEENIKSQKSYINKTNHISIEPMNNNIETKNQVEPNENAFYDESNNKKSLHETLNVSIKNDEKHQNTVILFSDSEIGKNIKEVEIVIDTHDENNKNK